MRRPWLRPADHRWPRKRNTLPVKRRAAVAAVSACLRRSAPAWANLSSERLICCEFVVARVLDGTVRVQRGYHSFGTGNSRHSVVVAGMQVDAADESVTEDRYISLGIRSQTMQVDATLSAQLSRKSAI